MPEASYPILGNHVGIGAAVFNLGNNTLPVFVLLVVGGVGTVRERLQALLRHISTEPVNDIPSNATSRKRPKGDHPEDVDALAENSGAAKGLHLGIFRALRYRVLR
jgi:hypothetical protein